MFKKHSDGTYSLTGRFWAYALVASLIIVWIGWRTQNTANQVEAQSMATRDCLTQVIEALTVAREVSVQNDDLSETQRNAFGEIIRAVIAPPAELAKMPADDLRRAQYVNTVAAEQFAIYSAAQDEQTTNALQRQQHPYPNPNCAILGSE